MFVLLLGFAAPAEPEPFHAFEGKDDCVAPLESMAFQKRLARSDDYGESWFVAIQGNDAPADLSPTAFAPCPLRCSSFSP